MNSKQIKDLSIRVKTIKFSEENMGVNLSELGLQWLLRYAAKRNKIDKLHFIKKEHFYA